MTVVAAYDPERLGFDLKEALRELRETPDSRYYDVTEAKLAGRLLAERVQQEVMKLRSEEKRKRVS